MKKLQLFVFFLAGIFLFSGCSDSNKSTTGKPAALSKAQLAGQLQYSANNLKQIGNALEFYISFADDARRPHGKLKNNRDVRKDAAAAFDILHKENHLPDPQVFVAPWDKNNVLQDPSQPLTDENTSYVYIYVDNQGNYAAPAVFEKPWRLPEGIDSLRVLYTNGSVASVNIPDVQKKGCREVLEILLEKVSAPQKIKNEWLKYAELADQKR